MRNAKSCRMAAKMVMVASALMPGVMGCGSHTPPDASSGDKARAQESKDKLMNADQSDPKLRPGSSTATTAPHAAPPGMPMGDMKR